ncbi:chorismate synthase [Candidatus Woesearchaeota archaeon]|nr:chorismate synthase [Candidatus Woesearchaeota archaeon]
MGDSFGEAFRVTNWGESHGPSLGCVISGCPPLLSLDAALDIQPDLNRRKPGQSKITSARKEDDIAVIESGVYRGKTTGTAIAIRIANEDQRPNDYAQIADVPRPNHADFTYEARYGIRDPAGGGRSSNRCFAPNVAAGAVAKKLLRERHGIEIVAFVHQVKDITGNVNLDTVTQHAVEENIVRCPDQEAAERMITLIETTKKSGDSLGGIVTCVIRNVPPGIGEPLYDKLDADLAKAMIYIGAAKGIDFGLGFDGITMTGSEYNDLFKVENAQVQTTTNHSGGIQGGISNGMPIYFRVAFKPTATILRPQQSVNLRTHEPEILQPKGRHDPCVLPRAVPNIEAMAALVLADHSIRKYGNAAVCIPAEYLRPQL